MKKILVTGSFKGAVALKYGESGIGAETFPPLLSVDISGAVLDDVQKTYILKYVPVRYGDGFAQAWGAGRLRFIEEDVEVDFEDDFWYPYDHLIHKIRAQKEWGNTNKLDRAEAVKGLGGFLRYHSRNSWKGKPLASRYLKERMWETNWDNLP